MYGPQQTNRITRSDLVTTDADLDPMPTGLFVGGGGNLEIQFKDDANATIWPSVPAGFWIYGAIKRINSAGTSATGLVATWNDGDGQSATV